MHATACFRFGYRLQRFNCKNPLSERWRTNTLRKTPYTLNELSNKLEINWEEVSKPIKIDDAVGLGRNCYLFHTARHWAYIAIRKYRGATYNVWLQSVLDHLLKLNESITEPLGYNEVRGIAKSIARWVWKRDPYCYAMFIERQSIRGRKGGTKSKRKSVSDSERSRKPWDEQGISRATYYRHKKNETR